MKIDIRKLNSITKYPSILTYHEMGKKGCLNDALSFDPPKDKQLILTEKVDGENTRIVFVVQGGEVDYFIGSREELIYAKGDRAINPIGGMVENIKPEADRISEIIKKDAYFKDCIVVIYQEIYGGKTPKSKQYTSDKSFGLRAFDTFKLDAQKVNELMSMELNKIAGWRQNGGQPYASELMFESICEAFDLVRSPIRMKVDTLPEDVLEMKEFIDSNFKQTLVGINKEGGFSEGVIARTLDRDFIVKIRFEDYNRTAKMKNKA